MRFGAVPTGQAAGAILAHTHRLPGRTILKKGRLLSAEDAARLAEAGHAEVVVARLDPDDVREDEAARRLAASIAGPGTRAEPPSTGRVNVFASERGLLRVEPTTIDAVNAVHESLTVGTLAPHSVVEPGEMVATVKVIPFAVPRALLERSVAAAEDAGPAVRVAPFRAVRAGLLLTRLPGLAESLLDRAAAVQRARVERLGGRLAVERRCPHDEASVAEALAQLLAEDCDPVLVMGASAIVDRADVVPAAVRRVGGRLVHLGMPVDPGNLLLLARAPAPGGGDATVVGVPGCARSPKESGFDWVLARLAAGLEVDGRTIQAMGVGGLLKEIAARPQLREAPQATPAVVDGEARPHRVGGVVLAAGLSRRMGERNKLLEPVDGRPMVVHAVEALLRAGVEPVVVVVGHEEARVRAALAAQPVRFVRNARYEEGLGTSLAAGVAALAAEALDGAIVSLADMPWVREAHVRALIEAFAPEADRAICVPVHDRKRGNPVLFGARFFPELRRLGGDVGARSIVEAHADQVHAVPVDDPAVRVDVDTPEALRALAGAQERT